MDQQPLPWLKPAHRVHKEVTSEENAAIADFMDKYVIYPCNESSTPGFLEHLPSLFKDVNVKGRYALRWAVQAAAFADLSRTTGSQVDVVKALEFYSRSLAAFQSSLCKTGKAPDDYDLMTVVMLDIFEVSQNLSNISRTSVDGPRHYSCRTRYPKDLMRKVWRIFSGCADMSSFTTLGAGVFSALPTIDWSVLGSSSHINGDA